MDVTSEDSFLLVLLWSGKREWWLKEDMESKEIILDSLPTVASVI